MLDFKMMIQQLVAQPSVLDKLNIRRTHEPIGQSIPYLDPFAPETSCTTEVFIGDDCAALPDGHGGFLLFASEGIVTDFLNAYPWFAGYCAVMVNISDVCAMGGIPMAITDVLWLKDEADGREIWNGMLAAAEAYGVPIVGGHTCYRNGSRHLAVSILGKANKLIASNTAEPGDALLMVVDLNGAYFEDFPFWNASTTASPEKLRKDMRLMAHIAEQGLSCAGKDISMGGVIGTLSMLLQCSEVGAVVEVDLIPRPDHVPLQKWLISFPSFGYLLTAKKKDIPRLKDFFTKNDISCEAIGEITMDPSLIVKYEDAIEKIY